MNFQKIKRLSNELLQNALKTKQNKKTTPVSVRTTCYLSFFFCIKRKLVFFFFFGKFLKNIAKSAFKEIGRKLAEWRKSFFFFFQIIHCPVSVPLAVLFLYFPGSKPVYSVVL